MPERRDCRWCDGTDKGPLCRRCERRRQRATRAVSAPPAPADAQRQETASLRRKVKSLEARLGLSQSRLLAARLEVTNLRRRLERQASRPNQRPAPPPPPPPPPGYVGARLMRERCAAAAHHHPEAS